MTPCPPDAQLRQLLDEQLAASQEEVLAAHVERCPSCQKALEHLAAHTDLEKWRRLREEPTVSGSVPEFLDQLKQEPPGRPAGTPWTGPSRTLAGYVLERELGRGGCGVVYQAYHLVQGRRVALKTLQHLDPEALSRFKHEFRALADVTHPHLVALYDLVSDGHWWFFTMELIDGVNFLAHVRGETSSKLSPPAALTPAQLVRLREAFRQLADGISALHPAGKLHRDIKPNNVRVSREGRVVLLDFGLATELDPTGLYQSTEQRVLGTAAYMAPEQAAGLPVSAASDWYSVGVMLYEALTGQLPFRGPSLQVLLEKQQSEPAPPCDLVPGIPLDLNALCIELLRRDPGTRPKGPEVLRRLAPRVELATAPSPVPAPKPPFVGRERQLEALTEVFRAVTQGRTVVLGIHGPSGVGKTALVQNFLGGLIETGQAVVLAGKCYQQEAVPYKALDNLVDALSHYLRHLPPVQAAALLPREVTLLARLFPVLGRVAAVAEAPGRAFEIPDPHEFRRRAVAALRELLARLGDRRPLVLCIDDLQWGDVDSAILLGDLLCPPDPPALFLLGCYRSEEVATSPFLQTFLNLKVPERRELAVEPLPPAEARELALALLGPQDLTAPDQATMLAQEAEGNPFFIQQLVQYLQAGTGPMHPAAAVRDIRLDQVIQDHIQHLPEEARRLLEVVAVAGQPLAQAEASWAAELSGDEVAALVPLRTGRFVRTRQGAEGDEIETYHDRIRETVVAHLPPATRAVHHSRLALVLEVSGRADPEAVAGHFREAGQSDRAAEYYIRAADQAAAALAFKRAAQLYRLVFQLGPVAGAQERKLRTRLADALANAGHGVEAAREYLAAAEGLTPAEALDFQGRAALQLLINGHVDDGLDVLRTVLARVGMRLPATPRGALASLLLRRGLLWLRGLRFQERPESQVPPEDLTRIDICWSVAAGLSIIDPIRAADFQTRHLLSTLRAGEPGRIARALAVEAVHQSFPGVRGRRQAEALLRTAEALAQRVANPYVPAVVRLAQGSSAYLAGSWRAGLEGCDQAEAMFRDRCTGVAWELDTAHTFALWSLLYMGDLAELSRRWPALVAEARERGDRFALNNLITYPLAILRLAADDPEGARQGVAESLSQWSQQGFHVQHLHALFARVHIDLYSGQGLAAWERILEQKPAATASMLMRVQRLRVYFRYQYACIALAAASAGLEPRPLLRAVEQTACQLAREGVAWAEALGRLLRACLAAFRGQSEAVDLLADAATRLEAVDMRLCAAAVRRRQGELMGGETGQALRQEADLWMKNQAIQNPARMSAMYVPGIGGPLPA